MHVNNSAVSVCKLFFGRSVIIEKIKMYAVLNKRVYVGTHVGTDY